MSEHTPEPWQQGGEDRLNSVRDTDKKPIAWTNISTRSWEEGFANTRRIVAAINFLEGIPTEALENMVNTFSKPLITYLTRMVYVTSERLDNYEDVREIFDTQLSDACGIDLSNTSLNELDPFNEEDDNA